MKFVLIGLVALAASCFGAVPFGRDVKVGAVTVNVSTIGGSVPGVPSVPYARSGLLVAVKDGSASTSRYVVTVEAKLTEGRTVSQTEIVKRPDLSREYTSVVFLVGPVSEIVSISVEELSTTALVKVVD